MEIGTIEEIDDEEEAKPKSSSGGRRQRSGRSGGGNGGDGGDSGDDGAGDGERKPPKKKEPEPNHSKPEIARVFMWFLLLVVLMTFGGLVAAYVVLATNRPLEWNPFSLPNQVWISTAILILSGITYHFGYRNLLESNFKRAQNFFLATSCLGGLFILSQVVVWLTLFNQGIVMKSNPYAGLFYVLTAVHAAHVLGGVIALGYVLGRTWGVNPEMISTPKLKMEAKAIGWYWHTMDILWIFLVFLLGYWN